MISDDAQLLKDIELTRKEMEAYQKIYDGYAILAVLPESVETEKNYKYELMRYSLLKDQCSEYLQEMLKLKKKRGLE
jgi:hypothetical protein